MKIVSCGCGLNEKSLTAHLHGIIVVRRIDYLHVSRVLGGLVRVTLKLSFFQILVVCRILQILTDPYWFLVKKSFCLPLRYVLCFLFSYFVIKRKYS